MTSRSSVAPGTISIRPSNSASFLTDTLLAAHADDVVPAIQRVTDHVLAPLSGGPNDADPHRMRPVAASGCEAVGVARALKESIQCVLSCRWERMIGSFPVPHRPAPGGMSSKSLHRPSPAAVRAFRAKRKRSERVHSGRTAWRPPLETSPVWAHTGHPCSHEQLTKRRGNAL